MNSSPFRFSLTARGELAVHLAIRPPVRGVEVAAGVQVVEERPDDLVGEPVVELVALLGRQAHRGEVVARRRAGAGQQGVEIEALLVAGAGPADPSAAALAQDGRQCSHQAAGAGPRAPLPLDFSPRRPADGLKPLTNGNSFYLAFLVNGCPRPQEPLEFEWCQPQVGRGRSSLRRDEDAQAACGERLKGVLIGSIVTCVGYCGVVGDFAQNLPHGVPLVSPRACAARGRR